MTERSVTNSEGVECPYCRSIHICEELESVVSFWGQEGGNPTPYTCQSCEMEFEVTEAVTRSWESTAIVQPKTVTQAMESDGEKA